MWEHKESGRRPQALSRNVVCIAVQERNNYKGRGGGKSEGGRAGGRGGRGRGRNMKNHIRS